ncbi:MAG: MmcQ/YjbR family DNA-binding protein [Betaproteobacteria bacterium]
MNVAGVKKFCAGLPGVTGDIKWEVDLVYSVGGRMFCVAFTDRQGKQTVSFKVDDDLFLQYTDREGFIPAPYLARAKWVQVIDLKKVADAELKSLIRRSHELVALKLTKKRRAELGIG